jgi:hypothetical protein
MVSTRSTLPTDNLITVSLLLSVLNHSARNWRHLASFNLVLDVLWNHIDGLQGDEHAAAILLVRLDTACSTLKLPETFSRCA